MPENIVLPDGVSFIIGMLQNEGYEAFAVGGCVRDSLLKKKPDDWDITTSAYPLEVKNIFRKAGCTVIPTGIKHGTVTVIYHKRNYEVTTFRIDGMYTDGRRPENVVFTNTVDDDLKRRDFTINAMAYNNRSGLIDLFGGRLDLENKLIRCVGNAGERISEDYLRMLRAYRFAATLSFELDNGLIETVAQNKHKILGISAERIRVEFEKIILSNNFNAVFEFFDVFLELLIPEIFENNTIDKIKKIFPHTENNLYIRLAALFYNSPPDVAVKSLKRMKYDNKTIDITSKILYCINFEVSADKIAVKRVLFKAGQEVFLYLNSVQKAICSATGAYDMPVFEERIEILNQIIANNEAYTIKALNISGNDIMEITGKKAGINIGKTLNRLLDCVIANPELNETGKLTELVYKLDMPPK